MNILEQILQEIEKESDLAREEMRRCVTKSPLQFYKIKEYVRALENVLEIIRSHMEDDGWIPVEERLPTQEEYLKDDGRFILDDGNRRYQGLFDIYDGKFKISKHISGINYELFEDKCVKAWKPLPKPFRPKEDA